ncbi:MAG: dual specificity protein phosphatase family protein [Lentisphaerae bacterium]|nr:dual specificity protein phosphatase family protein [Lentisphaerota bacterium]
MNNNNPNQANFPSRRSCELRCLVKALFVILAVVAGAWTLWELTLADRLMTKRWGVVEPELIYRSGQIPSARLQATLARHHIGVLIDLTGNQPGKELQLKDKERAAAARLGIEYHNFPLRGDGTGDIAHYAQAIAILHSCRRAGRPALIHCAAGAQRTGGVVAAYRVLVERRSPAEARAELERYGWKPGKDQMLLNYLNRNMLRLAELLQTLQVIETVPNPLPRL